MVELRRHLASFCQESQLAREASRPEEQLETPPEPGAGPQPNEELLTAHCRGALQGAADILPKSLSQDC